MAKVDSYDDPAWRGTRFRLRRFGIVRAIIEDIIRHKGHCRIADVGGTETYWSIGKDVLNTNSVFIDIINLDFHRPAIGPFGHIRGDACELGFIESESYDFAHSNSVIEHVGDLRRMEMMAKEIQRIAPRYFVQTPYFWFPFEPHFRLPCFHWLPYWARIRLIMKRDLGYMSKAETLADAAEKVRSAQLLDKRQFSDMFPDAKIIGEKYFGVTKSLMAVR